MIEETYKIGFCLAFQGSNSNILSQGIKLATGSKWSHCFFTCGDYMHTPVIYESADLRVYISPLRDYLTPDSYIEFYQLSQMKIVEYMDMLEESWAEFGGQPYGVAQLFGNAYVRMNRILGRDIDNPFKHGMGCSELIHKTFQLNSKNIFVRRKYFELMKLEKPDVVSPEDLYKIVISNIDMFKLAGTFKNSKIMLK